MTGPGKTALAKRLAAICLSGIVFANLTAVPAFAEDYILRLDPVSEEESARWNNDGFRLLKHECGQNDIACIRAALTNRSGSGAAHLIVSDKHTAITKQLYENGVTKKELETVVLLRSDPDVAPPIEAQPNGPDLLIFGDMKDTAARSVPSRRFASAVREAGIRSTLLFAPAGLLDRPSLDRMIVDIFLHFIGRSPFNEDLTSLFDSYTAWQSPPFNHDALSAQTGFIDEYEMNDQIRLLLKVHYTFEPHLLTQWPLETYKAFDLMAYRDKVAPGARYLTLRNIRQQVMYLDLEQYGQYRPQIIVAIDDETNLYRMAWFYKTKAMYSWLPEVPALSARLFGPFLYFAEKIPDEMQWPMLLRSALSLDGIEFSNDDPLAPIKKYPEAVQRVITMDNKCIYCHQIEGLGGRYHHFRADNAEPQGGVAIPLEAYPDFAMNAFLYDQVATAKKIGMTPNPLPDEVVATFDAWYRSLPKISDPEIEPLAVE